MNPKKRTARWVVAASLATISLAVGTGHALELLLEPAQAQRAAGGKVRVNLFADAAVDLISMGVQVRFDPTIVQAVGAAKYEDFAAGWIFDADGSPATTGDQYTSPAPEIDNVGGSVTLIGGRLTGANTIGLSGTVLLGWIVFEAIGDGTAHLTVDRARYHPDPEETYDNFVQAVGVVDEPSNVPGDLGVIYVGADACEGDLNDDDVINFLDLGMLKANFFTDCSTLPPGQICLGDLNGDGVVNFVDLGLIKQDFFRGDCPL